MRTIKSALAYDKDIYNVDVLLKVKPLSTKEMRQEYYRLRQVANKRLKRFQGTQFVKTQTYKNNVGRFKATRDISDKDIAFALSDVAQFVEGKYSSLTGQKNAMKKSLKTLAEHGYDGINEDNYLDFVEYMNNVKEDKEAKQYSSKQMADLFSEVHEKLSPDVIVKNFKTLLEEKEKKQESAIRKKQSKNKNQSSAKFSKYLFNDS